jgi:hypothetical protein
VRALCVCVCACMVVREGYTFFVVSSVSAEERREVNEIDRWNVRTESVHKAKDAMSSQ